MAKDNKANIYVTVVFRCRKIPDVKMKISSCFRDWQMSNMLKKI